jgi:hypothetical protein
MKRITFFSLFFVVSLLSFNSAYTWERINQEDAVVVERSELIAVAHIKEGTIEYIPHQNKQNEGESWEYHAKLVITEVLKGKCDEKEIPIIIHYGLTPVVGGYVKRDNRWISSRGEKTDYPEGTIKILDTADAGGELSVKDAREDNLWFLRKRSGTVGEKPGTVYGIIDPEDLQSIELKDYFLAYLAKNPESAVKEWVKKNPDKQTRVQRYFDHLDIQRILKITDVNDRLEKLQPYFLKRTGWDMKEEAKLGIISCGKAGGDYLMKSFDDPNYKRLRLTIIQIWREMKYKECVPFLISLIKNHNLYCVSQSIKNGWWQDKSNPEQTYRIMEISSEISYSIYTLEIFRDSSTKEILEQTRNYWKSIGSNNQPIVEECEAALKALSEQKNARN